ncbi:DNA-directed RNA polymerase subunit B'' [Methanopyrus sp. KOL6]|uniref:DNA-directed RNA polymerase subunit B'' n=1 Tax=Methanopyrus sp. KOL6 TaxID=1937004 RepID=UPI000B4A5CD9|nr:DNA-directed RNA polymerase subunit B'' [Methanopyrus sp. KOL6]
MAEPVKSLSEEDYLALLEGYLRRNEELLGDVKTHPLIAHHFMSYHWLIDEGLQQLIEQMEPIEPEVEGASYRIEFESIEVGEPSSIEPDGARRKIYPMEARLRNMLYSAPLYAEIVMYEDGEEVERDNVYVGELPVMVRSKVCNTYDLSEEELIEVGEDPKDPGGYFIINGSERVLVSLEDIAPNRLVNEKIRERGVLDEVRSRVYSRGERYRGPVDVIDRKGHLVVDMPAVYRKFPVVILLRALGLTEEEIMEGVGPEFATIMAEQMRVLVKEEIGSQEDALEYIGRLSRPDESRKERIQRGKEVLAKYFLPHIAEVDDLDDDEKLKEVFRKKADEVLKMVREVLELKYRKVKVKSVRDRDHYANKRIKLAGDLLYEAYEYAFQQLAREMRYQFERAYSRGREPTIRYIVRPDKVTDHIRSCMSTGTWRTGHYRPRTGVSQILERHTWMSTMSHLRRIRAATELGVGKWSIPKEARYLHPTHMGRLCPNETPEGANCGAIKNLALYAEVVHKDADEDEVIEILEEIGLETE